MLGFVSHLNKPSAFTATSSSSSIPVHPPHQYALQLLNVRASYCTVRDGKEERSQYSRRGGDVSAYFISDSLHSKLLTFTPLLKRLSPFGQSMDVLWFGERPEPSRLLIGGLFAVAVVVNNERRGGEKRKGWCLPCTGFVNFASCPRWLSVRLCVARKGEWLLSFGEVKVIAPSDWYRSQGGVFFSCFFFAVILASTNRATCLSWRRRWINYWRDMISDWGRTLEVCVVFIPPL